MDHVERRYQYSVVRDVGGPHYADVALVRASAPHGVIERLLHQERRDAIVLAHRTNRPMFEDTDRRDDGMVRVALYERWFDGRRLRCERLAVRDFDATEPDALVASTEFLTELQGWAADRNDEREDGYIEAALQESDRAERATERDDAARQLAEILAAHNTPADIE